MSVRDYGMVDPTPFVRGAPRITGEAIGPCPHCKCPTLYHVQVNVEMPMLKTGKGIGEYVGCAACPWASPMVSRSI